MGTSAPKGRNKRLPRGIRNNNPGNIGRSGLKWEGMLPRGRGSDQRYMQFETPEHGIRAAAGLLLRYKEKYNLDTVQGIISRWAPSGDNNNTAEYVRWTADNMGVKAGEHLDVSNPDTMARLVKSIIEYENGQGYGDHYSYDMIRENAAIAIARYPDIEGNGEAAKQSAAGAAIHHSGVDSTSTNVKIPNPESHHVNTGIGKLQVRSDKYRDDLFVKVDEYNTAQGKKVGDEGYIDPDLYVQIKRGIEFGDKDAGALGLTKQQFNTLKAGGRFFDDKEKIRQDLVSTIIKAGQMFNR